MILALCAIVLCEFLGMCANSIERNRSAIKLSMLKSSISASMPQISCATMHRAYNILAEIFNYTAIELMCVISVFDFQETHDLYEMKK